MSRYSNLYANEVHTEYEIAIVSPTLFEVHGTHKKDGSLCMAGEISGSVRYVRGDTLHLSRVEIDENQREPARCVSSDSVFVVLKEARVATVERRRNNDGASAFWGAVLLLGTMLGSMALGGLPSGG